MTARIWRTGSTVAVIRLGALWYLVSREWTHQQTLATLPLVLLLFPEGLLLPSPLTWTATLALVFSAALIAGSFVWVMVLALVMRLVRLR